jgi:TRAP-type C4-dicarboxylate transport system substrate-binding protein
MANGFTFQMNAKKFDALPQETQDILIKAADKAAEFYNKWVSDNEQKLLKEMESQGMEIVKIDQAPFREKAKEVVAQFPAVQDWYLKMVSAK